MNSNNETMNVLSDLIEFESVTPDKSGCQKYIDNYLSKFGFETKTALLIIVQPMGMKVAENISTFSCESSQSP